MSQNLISITLTNDQIVAIDHAIGELENQLQSLVSLSIDARRTAAKMGPKSEAFCRQTINALRLYVGDLSTDQRHRARLWINYRLPWVNGLTVSALQTLTSGTPYGTGNLTNSATPSGIDPRPYVTNPGYITPPSGSATAYFYIARDAFRLEGEQRTDFSVNYTRKLRKSLEVFGQFQVLNLFNQFQLCGCGATTVFTNGSGVNGQTINQAILTSVTNPATYAAFNPFTTTPVKGVNWDFGPNFGKPQNRFAYTTPQTVRVSFGVRF